VLWSKTIIQDDRRTRSLRDTSCQVAMRGWAADYVAAAMQVEEPLVCSGVVSHHPLCRDAPGLYGCRRGAFRDGSGWEGCPEYL
jgi:hypothetical protein